MSCSEDCAWGRTADSTVAPSKQSNLSDRWVSVRSPARVPSFTWHLASSRFRRAPSSRLPLLRRRSRCGARASEARGGPNFVNTTNAEAGRSRVGLAMFLLGAALLTIGLGIWQVRRNAAKQAWIGAMRGGLAEPAGEVAAALADTEALAFRRGRAGGGLRTPGSVLLGTQT